MKNIVWVDVSVPNGGFDLHRLVAGSFFFFSSLASSAAASGRRWS